MDPDGASVGGVHPVLVVERGEVLGIEGVDRLEPGAVVWVDQLAPQRRVVHEPLRGEAEDVLDLGAHERHVHAVVGRDVEVGDARDALDELAVPLLGGLAPPIGQLAMPGRRHDRAHGTERALLRLRPDALGRGVLDHDPAPRRPLEGEREFGGSAVARRGAGVLPAADLVAGRVFHDEEPARARRDRERCQDLGGERPPAREQVRGRLGDRAHERIAPARGRCAAGARRRRFHHRRSSSWAQGTATHRVRASPSRQYRRSGARVKGGSCLSQPPPGAPRPRSARPAAAASAPASAPRA